MTSCAASHDELVSLSGSIRSFWLPNATHFFRMLRARSRRQSGTALVEPPRELRIFKAVVVRCRCWHRNWLRLIAHRRISLSILPMGNLWRPWVGCNLGECVPSAPSNGRNSGWLGSWSKSASNAAQYRANFGCPGRPLHRTPANTMTRTFKSRRSSGCSRDC